MVDKVGKRIKITKRETGDAKKHDAVYCPPKMCGVVDVAAAPFVHHRSDDKVQRAKNKARNNGWQNKQADFIKWSDKNSYKNDG